MRERLTKKSVLYYGALQGGRLYYKFNFDKYKVEFIAIDNYKRDVGSARCQHDKKKWKGGEDCFIETLKYEYPYLSETDLDFLCKQISQIMIQRYGYQGFISLMQITLYNSVTKRVSCLKRFNYD